MKKLEKSIRRELKDFGPSLRNGHVWVTGHSVGIMGENDYFMQGAYADVDVSEGIVTDIRIYAVGEGRLSRDFNEETLNITEQIEGFLLEHNESFNWDDLICSIAEVAEEFIRNAE